MPVLLWIAAALASPLNPNDFTSLGSANPSSSVTIDTDALSMSGGGLNVTGVEVGGTAVFTFDTVNFFLANVSVTGSRPVAILSRGNFSLRAASISASASGPSAGAGGHDEEAGPGAGTSNFYGGGGGFGGAGGSGGILYYYYIPGGPAYGDLKVLLEGGSGGGAGVHGRGGGGGGAIELGAGGTMTIWPDGNVQANGAGAELTYGTYADGGGGGGSGGGILIHAGTVDLQGSVRATGGDGTFYGYYNTYTGGGGGGGRVCISSTSSFPNIHVDGGFGVTAGAPGEICDPDVDGDGVPFHRDCDDNDPTRYPGAIEDPCDGVDNDCSGVIDETRVDADGDGYDECIDCDDADPSISPADNDSDGFTLCDGDCDDADALAYPGATEVVGDGADQSCDGLDALAGPEALAPGDLVLTELMVAPGLVSQSDGEWVELASLHPNVVDLIGLEVWIDGVEHRVDGHLVVGAGGLLVLGNNANSALNGGVGVDLPLAGMSLDDTASIVSLELAGTAIDEVAYDVSTGWPAASGASMNLDPRALTATDNDDPVHWCLSNTAWGGGDLGTPGQPNISCDRDLDADGAPESVDCDDADAALNLDDVDADGFSTCDGDCDDADPALDPADADADGYSTCDGDCRDDLSDVNPGSTEIPDNGLDDDCLGGDEQSTPGTGTTTGTGTGATTGTGTGTSTGTTGTEPTDTGLGDDKGGCNCSTSGSLPVSGVWLGLALLGLRRRPTARR